ncbi:hypothetical protein JOB18_021640 [Solea senegalensis]|uniref:Uncharacterized protein n=1 Tax=Solea senegalensis TaxID=28829 RepID=A0AAV6QWN2_SOLSE|nr:hypothetical protein JOB18_021640 [Solea senegalensis]
MSTSSSSGQCLCVGVVTTSPVVDFKVVVLKCLKRPCQLPLWFFEVEKLGEGSMVGAQQEPLPIEDSTALRPTSLASVPTMNGLWESG